MDTDVVQLDEARIAEDAADFSRRLAALTARVEDERIDSQGRFDTTGLPRGLMPLEAM
jgi:hypothetical protein